MSGVGQSPLVRDGALRFFAKYQRADGKITHEISQGAGHVDWFSYPYPFYHGDTSPFWILAFGEYWRQTDDGALLRELWPNLKRAYDWSLATDKNGDGLMENPSAGAGALEVGDLQVGILSDVYMSGVWVAALERFARMADGDGRLRTGRAGAAGTRQGARHDGGEALDAAAGSVCVRAAAGRHGESRASRRGRRRRWRSVCWTLPMAPRWRRSSRRRAS